MDQVFGKEQNKKQFKDFGLSETFNYLNEKSPSFGNNAYKFAMLMYSDNKYVLYKHEDYGDITPTSFI